MACCFEPLDPLPCVYQRKVSWRELNTMLRTTCLIFDSMKIKVGGKKRMGSHTRQVLCRVSENSTEVAHSVLAFHRGTESFTREIRFCTSCLCTVAHLLAQALGPQHSDVDAFGKIDLEAMLDSFCPKQIFALEGHGTRLCTDCIVLCLGFNQPTNVGSRQVIDKWTMFLNDLERSREAVRCTRLTEQRAYVQWPANSSARWGSRQKPLKCTLTGRPESSNSLVKQDWQQDAS